MPEISSQTPGARKGAMEQIGQRQGGQSPPPQSFNDAASGQAMPETERGLDSGQGEGGEPLGTAATKRRMREEKRQAQKKEEASPEKSREQQAQAEQMADSMSDLEDFDEKDVGRLFKQAKKTGVKETTKSAAAGMGAKAINSAINQFLIDSGWAGIVAPPEGWVYYLMCVAALWLIGLGFEEFAKNLILKIIRFSPVMLMPGINKILGEQLDIFERMKLKLAAEDWLGTLGLTIPLVLVALFIAFLVFIFGLIWAVMFDLGSIIGSINSAWVKDVVGGFIKSAF